MMTATMGTMMIAHGVLYLALLTLVVLGIVWLVRSVRTSATDR